MPAKAPDRKGADLSLSTMSDLQAPGLQLGACTGGAGAASAEKPMDSVVYWKANPALRPRFTQ